MVHVETSFQQATVPRVQPGKRLVCIGYATPQTSADYESGALSFGHEVTKVSREPKNTQYNQFLLHRLCISQCYTSFIGSLPSVIFMPEDLELMKKAEKRSVSLDWDEARSDESDALSNDHIEEMPTEEEQDTDLVETETEYGTEGLSEKKSVLTSTPVGQDHRTKV